MITHPSYLVEKFYLLKSGLLDKMLILFSKCLYYSQHCSYFWRGGERNIVLDFFLSPRSVPVGVDWGWEVPSQGSVLSPLLFNIYIKPLLKSSIIMGWDISSTDNTQLYISAPGKLSDTIDILSWCLEAVEIWMGNNRFWLNPEKTK